VPVVAAAFWLGERARGGRLFSAPALARLATMTLVAVAVIAPWLIRNRLVHGELVFIKSSFGYAFWQGNHPMSWGTDKIPKPAAEEARRRHDGTLSDMDRALWEARHETLYIDDVVLKPLGYGRFAGLTEPQRSRLLGTEAWGFIRRDPLRYGRLCLQRLRYFLLFDETNPKASNQLYRTSTVIWLALAFVGLAATAGAWRPLWPTYAIFTLVALFHTLVIVSTRFRIPVEPLSFVWAAGAVAPVLARWLDKPAITVRRPGEMRHDPFERAAHVLHGPHYRTRKRMKDDVGRMKDEG